MRFLLALPLFLAACCSSAPTSEIKPLASPACSPCVDGPPRAAVALDVAWPRHTIYNGPCDATHQCSGADGVHLVDVNGDGLVDITSPWEQSSKVSGSLHPGYATVRAVASWPTVIVPCTLNAIEDAKFADVDGDGNFDIITAGDAGQKISIAFGPPVAQFLTPSAWTCITVTASSVVPAKENWIQIAFADLDGDGIKDIVAGGRTTTLTGKIGYFTSTQPRVASSWMWHEVSLAGVTWSLVPMDIDGDGDLDLVVSDGGTVSGLMGSRALINPLIGGGGTWINRTIHVYNGTGQLARFLHAEPLRVIDGSSRETGASFLNIRTTTDWLTWTAQNVPWPSDAGHYNAVRPGDLDGDGIEDLAVTMHHADSDYTTPPQDLSGVLWLRGDGSGGWQRGEVSGVDGVKYDNLELVDIDGDGDLDIVTSEQGMAGVTPPSDKLGVVWYENPSLN